MLLIFTASLGRISLATETYDPEKNYQKKDPDPTNGGSRGGRSTTDKDKDKKYNGGARGGRDTPEEVAELEALKTPEAKSSWLFKNNKIPTDLECIELTRVRKFQELSPEEMNWLIREVMNCHDKGLIKNKNELNSFLKLLVLHLTVKLNSSADKDKKECQKLDLGLIESAKILEQKTDESIEENP